MRCAPAAQAAAVALQAARVRLIVAPRSALSMSKPDARTPDRVHQQRSDEAALADWTRLAAEHGVPLLVVEGA